MSVISYFFFVVVVLARTKLNPGTSEPLRRVPAWGALESPLPPIPEFSLFFSCLPPLESHLCTLQLRGYLLVS